MSPQKDGITPETRALIECLNLEVAGWFTSQKRSPRFDAQARTQRLQYPFIRDYTLNHRRVPTIIYIRCIPELRDIGVSGILHP